MIDFENSISKKNKTTVTLSPPSLLHRYDCIIRNCYQVFYCKTGTGQNGYVAVSIAIAWTLFIEVFHQRTMALYGKIPMIHPKPVLHGYW